MNDTRNEFERIMANHAVLSWSDSMGEYRSVATQKMWEVWQAARAQGACEWAEQLDACEFHGNDHEVCAEYSGQVPCARAQSGQGADAVKWSDPAVDPIVSKLYRKFKEWNRQGFGADDVTWCEVRGYVAELLNAQPHPAQQWSVPEGWKSIVDRIVPDISPEPDQNEYPAEWSLWADRQRIRRELSLLSTPTKPQADGWVLVPADHLPEVMEKAAVAAAREYTARTGGNCMKTIYKALVKAAPQPPAGGPPQADGWVRCDERLPTYRDSDEYGDVWVMSKLYGVKKMPWSSVRADFESHWMPTGLKRPQPPQEGE